MVDHGRMIDGGETEAEARERGVKAPHRCLEPTLERVGKKRSKCGQASRNDGEADFEHGEVDHVGAKT